MLDRRNFLEIRGFGSRPQHQRAPCQRRPARLFRSRGLACLRNSHHRRNRLRPSPPKSGSRPRPLPIPSGAVHSGPTGPETAPRSWRAIPSTAPRSSGSNGAVGANAAPRS